MAQDTASLTSQPEWQALAALQQQLKTVHMRDLFAQDPDRGKRFFAEGAGLSLDYAKNLINEQVLDGLLKLARARDLSARTEALFRGERVNTTEQRPALHTALRGDGNDPLLVNGQDIVPDIQDTLARMKRFTADVLGGQRRGHTGKPFTDVVSIGIGGSYLGPKLAAEALRPFHQGQIRPHFVANIDGTDISEVLAQVSPETTLFLVQSKSFRTQETLENTRVAKDWFLANGGSQAAVAKHFVAVTANTPEAVRFGITTDNVFPMWDWVGGRYSLWSAIGLPIALVTGMDHFRALLEGARAMDEHFRHTPWERNLPVLMALLSVWYNNFWGAETHAILPYDHTLDSLPAHLQQLDMESNGKCVTQDGHRVAYQTGPIIWGGVGANGQHAYHQLLHQGTRLIPADFIIPLQSHHPVCDHHAALFANCLSQSRALMAGKTESEARDELMAAGLSTEQARTLAPHKAIPGNKPSNTLILDKLTPTTLGALIALYEHRTFVQGVIWDVDSFDQWGVELGKEMGRNIFGQLLGTTATAPSDSSTEHLIRLFRSQRP